MKENQTNKKITSKQVVAMMGIILLVLLYIVTLVLAIIGTEATSKWFGASLLATIFVPILIWIYTWVYGKLTGRHTIADAPETVDRDSVSN